MGHPLKKKSENKPILLQIGAIGEWFVGAGVEREGQIRQFHNLRIRIALITLELEFYPGVWPWMDGVGYSGGPAVNGAFIDRNAGTGATFATSTNVRLSHFFRCCEKQSTPFQKFVHVFAATGLRRLPKERTMFSGTKRMNKPLSSVAAQPAQIRYGNCETDYSAPKRSPRPC